MILWQLFISYLKIGFFGFGGGYAMLSLIQNEVVVQHQWMTAATTPTTGTSSTPGAGRSSAVFSWVRGARSTPSC